jgi:hypothetical protein
MRHSARTAVDPAIRERRAGIFIRGDSLVEEKTANISSSSSMYFLRGFSILCAISALVAVVFWIGDRITGMEFTQKWILVSSLLWGAPSWVIYRHLRKKHPEA